MLQSDFQLENYPVPDEYFDAPIEELFDLLGKTFVKFVASVNVNRCRLCISMFRRYHLICYTM